MCDEYIVLMNMLIDGEASPEERQRLSEHLNVCESCRAEYAHLRYMADSVRDMQQEVPDNLHNRIMSNLPSSKQVRIPFYRSKSFGLVAAACLMIVAAGVFIPSLGNFGAARKGDNFAVSEADAAMPTSPTAQPHSYYNGSVEPTSPGMVAPAEPEAAPTADKSASDVLDAQADRLVFSGSGVLPAEIDKYNPVYLSGEVVLWLDSAADSDKICNMLSNSGFKQTEADVVSKQCLDMIADKQYPIVIILK